MRDYSIKIQRHNFSSFMFDKITATVVFPHKYAKQKNITYRHPYSGTWCAEFERLGDGQTFLGLIYKD